MRYNLADLHIHSHCSDGFQSPTAVVEEACNAGLVAVSLTDHDTVAGVDEAVAAGERLGVRVIPGIEFSAHMDEREVHILAYFLDRRDARLLEHTERLREYRRARGVAIVERLNTLGVQVTIDDVLRKANGGLLGRPHIAAAMVERGAVANKELAFDLYIGDRKPADVPKPRIPYDALISMVHRLGGVTVLAHPGKSTSEAVVAQLAAAGMDGIEVFHPAHQPPQIEHYTEMAERYNLLPSGGSDSHGEPEGARIGDYGIGTEAVDALSARAAAHV